MVNPLRFLNTFLSLLASAGLILAALGAAFFILAVIMACVESPQLSFWESIYLSCITALTIGYGDFSPQTTFGRIVAVGLGMLGIVLTGVIVAAAIKALEKASETKNG